MAFVPVVALYHIYADIIPNLHLSGVRR